MKHSSQSAPSTTPSKRFHQALNMATELHRNQVRKGTSIPYLTHLLAVSGIVVQCGGSEDEAIAALLHDAVEDQGGAATLAVIRERFGGAVADVVQGCTDTDTVPKLKWIKRKRAYLAHLAETSESVLLVSAADKLDNARAILLDVRVHGDSVWKRFTGKRAGTLWYYRALVNAFQQREFRPAGLIVELAAVVSEIELLAGFSEASARGNEIAEPDDADHFIDGDDDLGYFSTPE